ncbi:hypothetical protein ACGF1Z_35040 [Streptomyces sp. NPDC048018]|uniref:MmyB family transcriptional regulator n=1 Tax=Streptomyces sp. NPDC048018 TaxID=3365499 RepID=UPI00371DA0CB
MDHYTRLEQGRSTGVSEAVLASVGRALRLDRDELAYLRALARPRPARPTAVPAGPDQALDPATRALLAGLGAAPALVLGPRNAILGWNAAAAALFLDFANLPPAERTLVRLLDGSGPSTP